MNYPAASSGVSNTLTKWVRSKLLAMNPKRFKFHQVLQEPRCGPFQIGFLFQVGDFAGRSMARGRYRRQREYPQPPPPSKSTTKITINRVSIVSPLFGLSILNSVRARCVPDLVVKKGRIFRHFLWPVSGNERRFVNKSRNSRPNGRSKLFGSGLFFLSSMRTVSSKENCTNESLRSKLAWSGAVLC
jgi:hypothetical protein